jgi:S1-C subfamily serine protease
VTDAQFVNPPAVTGHVNGPSLGVQEVREGRFKGNVRVGNASFQQPIVNITPIPSEFLQRWVIGWGALQHFTMTLDQRNRRLRLTATETAIAPPPPIIRVGIGWDPSEANGISLQYVDSAGPAFRQGFRMGDIILSFNDTLITPANNNAFAKMLDRPEPIRVTVRRAGEVKTMMLTPTVLVQ